MNTFITIATRFDGAVEVLATPMASYAEHKAIFKELEGDYATVELWSRSQGRIRSRRLKHIQKTKKKANR